MRVATLTTWHENRQDPPERVRKLDSCLRRNDGVGAVLWLYSQQSPMSVGTDTTKHENDRGKQSPETGFLLSQE